MIRTVIIEDEIPAALRLQKLLKEVEPGIQVETVLESVSGSIRWLSEHPPPDLLMLDIQLADGLSFEIFREVSIDSFVIFTTAYDEYAIKAFELNSVDYLLKPVDRKKLAQAISKLERLRGAGQGINIHALMEAMERDRKRYKERFVINMGSAIRSIEAGRIAYFYTMEKSTYLCTDQDRHFPVDHSLDRLEELLDPNEFFRINRQYTISYRAIEKINVLSKSRISVQTRPATSEPLLVATARTHSFRQWLDR